MKTISSLCSISLLFSCAFGLMIPTEVLAKQETMLQAKKGSDSSFSDAQNSRVSNLYNTQYDPTKAHFDSQEIRLKVRELTNQLLETWPASNLSGMTAYITTFTPQEDLQSPSPFGQYVRDAFIYEFNTRGFPVRDFSARSQVINKDGFAYGVSDNTYTTSVKKKNAVLLTGTFYADNNHLYLNARLIRGSDGMVLRTAQTIFTLNPILIRMATPFGEIPDIPLHPNQSPLKASGLPIVQGVKVK